MSDESTEATAEVDESTEATAEAPVSDTIRALLTERAGYLRIGKTARAEAVDEQLRLRGYADATDVNGNRLVPPVGEAAPKPSSARGRRTTKG